MAGTRHFFALNMGRTRAASAGGRKRYGARVIERCRASLQALASLAASTFLNVADAARPHQPLRTPPSSVASE